MRTLRPANLIALTIAVLGAAAACLAAPVSQAWADAPTTPHLSRPPDVRLRRLELIDGPRAGAGAWIVSGREWAAYASLSSPHLRAWVSGLPKGTNIDLEEDPAAPHVVGERPDAEVTSLSRFCEAHGLHLVRMPVA